MNAHEQWRAIERAFNPDSRRELPRHDWRSAQFADQVDRSVSLAGWLFFGIGLVLFLDWLIADVAAYGWAG